MDPWPSDVLRASLKRRPKEALPAGIAEEGSPEPGPCVVVTTGAMNPPHRGHTALVHQARARLEALGYDVLAGWISPSHDLYVGPKAMRLRTKCLSSKLRLHLGHLLTKDDDFVRVAAWESQSTKTRWPDFPEVVETLQDYVTLFPGASDALGPSGKVRVFYACGTDHAHRCGLYSGVGGGAEKDMGVVVVPREGEASGREAPQNLVFIAEPAPGDVASFSSTQVRNAMQDQGEDCYDVIANAIGEEAADLIMMPSDNQREQFPEIETLMEDS